MLDAANDFLSKWNLKVNKGKSAVMIFGSKKNINKFLIDNKVIEILESYKYLEKVDLSLKVHLKEKEKSINRIIKMHI